MKSFRPRVLASHRQSYWTLRDEISADGLKLIDEASGSLLLIAMHLQEERPWTAARNPLLFDLNGPGSIDKETKRILGKRHRQGLGDEAPLVELDPIALLLTRIKDEGLDLRQELVPFPERIKEPGKLLPREIIATLHIETDQGPTTWRARNMSELSQVLHAELILVFALSQWLSERPLAHIQSFKLHASLKPCRMCAAFLEAVKDSCDSFEVSYEEDDPGPLAQNTLLDQYGYSCIPKS